MELKDYHGDSSYSFSGKNNVYRAFPGTSKEKLEALDDMLIFNIPNYEKDNKSITQEDCYFYGLMLGDGSMSNRSTTSYISLNKTTKIANLEFIKTYLENKDYDICSGMRVCFPIPM